MEVEGQQRIDTMQVWGTAEMKEVEMTKNKQMRSDNVRGKECMMCMCVFFSCIIHYNHGMNNLFGIIP